MERQSNPAFRRAGHRAEAEALLDRTVQLAQAGNFAGLCDSVADTPGTCEFLLQSAEDMHATPGHIAPTVVGESYVDKTLVLHLSVVTGEGKVHDADFAVVRRGDVRSLTPVYWSGVTFAP